MCQTNRLEIWRQFVVKSTQSTQGLVTKLQRLMFAVSFLQISPIPYKLLSPHEVSWSILLEKKKACFWFIFWRNYFWFKTTSEPEETLASPVSPKPRGCFPDQTTTHPWRSPRSPAGPWPSSSSSPPPSPPPQQRSPTATTCWPSPSPPSRRRSGRTAAPSSSSTPPGSPSSPFSLPPGSTRDLDGSDRIGSVVGLGSGLRSLDLRAPEWVDLAATGIGGCWGGCSSLVVPIWAQKVWWVLFFWIFFVGAPCSSRVWIFGFPYLSVWIDQAVIKFLHNW